MDSNLVNRLVPFKDPDFLNAPAARPVRILSEYESPRERFRRAAIHDTVVFFGSARIREEGPLARYYHEARETARLITEWSNSLHTGSRRFVICTGGGPGIMEAANRGAADASGKSLGLNISLPFEQAPNPYVTPELSMEFHYFFMRKFWFAYPGKAFVMFPGGFGTLDEMMEVLTLAQTGKLKKKIIVLLYGSEFWNEVVNFDALVKHGVISPEDVNLFSFADDPKTAFTLVRDELVKHYLTKPEAETPAMPHAVDPYDGTKD